MNDDVTNTSVAYFSQLVAEIVRRMLEHQEEANTAQAQAVEKSSKLFEKVGEILGKSDMETASELSSAFAEIAAAQKRAAALHLSQGAYSARIRQDLAAMTTRQGYSEFQVITDKAAGEDELSKLQPSMVQMVIGPAPEPELRAVRRSGQPELPQRPNVAVQFEHLVKTEDETVPH